MKWFVYVFSLYLLILSGFTCNAAGDCCKEDLNTEASQGHKDDDHKPVSPCIPFLACGACHSVIATQISFEFEYTFISNRKLQFPYLEPSLKTSISSIWQPPQIS